ncbi:uncharacterized protein G2W53_038645 [Senna tora]|uniref:Uncharacterized protein n=1 Tax=Senna tora TaxID=362788 RepID=A0A834SM04_9FABA|nr:uncharacterized protein G2W53_038645 [Senna tora]
MGTRRQRLKRKHPQAQAVSSRSGRSSWFCISGFPSEAAMGRGREAEGVVMEIGGMAAAVAADPRDEVAALLLQVRGGTNQPWPRRRRLVAVEIKAAKRGPAGFVASERRGIVIRH